MSFVFLVFKNMLWQSNSVAGQHGHVQIDDIPVASHVSSLYSTVSESMFNFGIDTCTLQESAKLMPKSRLCAENLLSPI